MDQTFEPAITTENLSAPLTLQDLLNRITADNELTQRRRQDVRSSIKKFAKLLGLSLATLPADPHAYRRRLETFLPKANRIGPKRWQNVRSDVQFALNRYRPKSPVRGDIPMPLDALWTPLCNSLNDFYGIRASGLSRFMSYCVTHRVAPGDVSTDTFLQFQEWMETTQLAKHPERTMRRSAKLWNQAAAKVPDWPRTYIELSPAIDLYGCRWEELTTDLRVDTEAWLKRLGGNDLLDENGPSKPASETTLKSYKYTVCQIAGALRRKGLDISDLRSLADLFQPENVAAAVEFLRERTGQDQSSMLHHIATQAIAIARHHAGFSEREIGRLKNLQRKVLLKKDGLTSKNKERLAQFQSEANQHRLLCLPIKTFHRLGRHEEVQQRDALDAQCALAIEILLFAPIRRRNLVALNLERHIHIQKDRSQTRVFISIPAQEVKNAVDLDFELPPESGEILKTYINRFRPRLLNGTDAGWLFPGGQEGAHKAPEQFARNVTAFVRRETGLEINLHLFRHITAMLYLNAHPGSYEVVRRTHGHKKIETTTSHYTGLETAAATRQFDGAILQQRHHLMGKQATDQVDD